MSNDYVMRTLPVEEFYNNNGQRLINVENYPAKIADHLVCEKQLLAQIILTEKYETIVEVGCMNGSIHFDLFLKCETNYYGIDIIEKTICELNNKIKRLHYNKIAVALTLDVCYLRQLSQIINMRGKKILVVFPFNSFGNLANPERAINEVSFCDYDLVILTYQANKKSTRVRKKYYSNCYYENIAILMDEKGILFTSTDGLHTYAYKNTWIRQLFMFNKYECHKYKYGNIGVAYLGKKIK